MFSPSTIENAASQGAPPRRPTTSGSTARPAVSHPQPPALEQLARGIVADALHSPQECVQRLDTRQHGE